MKGREDGSERCAFSENFRGGSASRMVRSGRYKYCYFHEDREQLFDLRNDPAEIENLIGNAKYKELAASLKSRALEGWDPAGLLERRKRILQNKRQKKQGKA